MQHKKSQHNEFHILSKVFLVCVRDASIFYPDDSEQYTASPFKLRCIIFISVL